MGFTLKNSVFSSNANNLPLAPAVTESVTEKGLQDVQFKNMF